MRTPRESPSYLDGMLDTLDELGIKMAEIRGRAPAPSPPASDDEPRTVGYTYLSQLEAAVARYGSSPAGQRQACERVERDTRARRQQGACDDEEWQAWQAVADATNVLGIWDGADPSDPAQEIGQRHRA